MKVYNTTTGEMDSLTITDRKSGCEWTNDLVGNMDALVWSTEHDAALMSTEDIEWWSNIIDGLNEIEDMCEDCREKLSSEEWEDLDNRLTDASNANDLESHVSSLKAILKEVAE
jgi:uncharacterized alpha-E superfamily protein